MLENAPFRILDVENILGDDTPNPSAVGHKLLDVLGKKMDDSRKMLDVGYLQKKLDEKPEIVG